MVGGVLCEGRAGCNYHLLRINVDIILITWMEGVAFRMPFGIPFCSAHQFVTTLQKNVRWRSDSFLCCFSSFVVSVPLLFQFLCCFSSFVVSVPLLFQFLCVLVSPVGALFHVYRHSVSCGQFLTVLLHTYQCSTLWIVGPVKGTSHQSPRARELVSPIRWPCRFPPATHWVYHLVHLVRTCKI